MKIALDPYMFRRVPLTDLPGLVADLGYSCGPGRTRTSAGPRCATGSGPSRSPWTSA
jgi:hypothetical protein